MSTLRQIWSRVQVHGRTPPGGGLYTTLYTYSSRDTSGQRLAYLAQFVRRNQTRHRFRMFGQLLPNLATMAICWKWLRVHHLEHLGALTLTTQAARRAVPNCWQPAS